jgi:hypothetical protein
MQTTAAKTRWFSRCAIEIVNPESVITAPCHLCFSPRLGEPVEHTKAPREPIGTVNDEHCATGRLVRNSAVESVSIAQLYVSRLRHRVTEFIASFSAHPKCSP